MANILDVFKFKNNYQVTNLFNRLNLTPDQLVYFMDIVNEGIDIEQTRKQLLEFVGNYDFDSYIYIKDLLKQAILNETVDAELGLNEVIELNELIELVSKKMNNEIHNELVNLFNKKANQQIANVFFNYVKTAETSNKELKIDVNVKVGSNNVASVIYSLKNDILSIINNNDDKKSNSKELNIKECFKLPKELEKINNTKNIKSLMKLKEEYKKEYKNSNNLFYQQLLYETNLKINTQKLIKNKTLFEAINDHRKVSLWLNNVGKLIINPLTENNWEIIHYKHSISPISMDKLKIFLMQLTESYKDKEIDETPMSDNEFNNLKDNDKVSWDLSDGDYTVKKENGKTRFIGNNNQGNWNDLAGKEEYIKQYFSKGAKPMPDKNNLKDVQKQILAWENEIERKQNSDDFYYTNGNYEKDKRQLEYWKNLANKLKNVKENAELGIAGNSPEIDDDGLISQVLPKFILDIQDQVPQGQKYQGIKNRKIEKQEQKFEKNMKCDADDVEECTCAGGVAMVSKPLFSNKRKQSKDYNLAKEALEKIDEFKMMLNKKSIDYSSLNGVTLYVEGKIANVHNKNEVLKIFEMIDNNEDISQYLFEGLTKDDLDLLNEDGDMISNQPDENNTNGISSPNPEKDMPKPDTDPQYKQKKQKLSTIAQSGAGQISVKTIDTATGQEKVSDDYEIVGLEDLDDSGKSSNAVVKNKMTGKIETIDPHKIDIKESSNVKLNGISIYLTDDEQRIYDNTKSVGKLFASKMNEFDCRIADKLITKHLLKKYRNPENGIYYKTAGRKMKNNDFISTMTEIAPPSKEIENWINKNKDKFKKEYGNNYKKFLYGKAWTKYNGLKESFVLEAKAPKESFNFTLPCGKEVLGTKSDNYWLIEIQTEDYDFIDSFITDANGNIVDNNNFHKVCKELNINEDYISKRIKSYLE